MEKQTKLFLGKILGEIYRIEKRNSQISCPASVGRIYGLLNGFEDAIDQELESIGYISSAQVEHTCDILDAIYTNPVKMKGFKGFYDIERLLNEVGVDRGNALQILTYLYADGRFVELIDKMNTSDSPSECKTFKISEWDK